MILLRLIRKRNEDPIRREVLGPVGPFLQMSWMWYQYQLMIKRMQYATHDSIAMTAGVQIKLYIRVLFRNDSMMNNNRGYITSHLWPLSPIGCECELVTDIVSVE
ncbi:hypothetical protein TNCV_5079591 [Trichonephila clavipes]|nr:hypothetical protein TNCV_5079591 [Trichonephila clavipes]